MCECRVEAKVVRGLPEESDEFFNGLSTGEDLKAGNPILALHRRLCSLAAHKATRPYQRDLLALYVKAWNAYVEGRPISKLSYFKSSISGHKSERFPKLNLGIEPWLIEGNGKTDGMAI